MLASERGDLLKRSRGVCLLQNVSFKGRGRLNRDGPNTALTTLCNL